MGAISTRVRLAAACAGLLTICDAVSANDGQISGDESRMNRASILERLNLREGELARAVVSQQAEQITVSLQLANETREIVLTPHSLRHESFQVLVDAAGRLSPFAAPAVTTWRGTILGDDDSVVAASVIEGRLSIAVYPEHASAWFVQSATIADESADDDLVVVYDAADVSAGNWRCGIDEEHAAFGLDGRDDVVVERGSSCVREALIAFDADYEFFQQNGSSVPATVADIELVMNSVELIYARDVAISYAIGTIIVRSTDPDPYTQGVGGDILGEFGNYWRANHTDVPRDIAHLMTGRTLGNGVIGVAWISQICAPSDGIGYGFSQSRFTNDLPGRVGLTAHEVGHNWSAGHCDGDSDCYIMCSGLGGCSNDVTRFGTRSTDAILSFRNTRPCLDDVGPYPTPLAPHARGDSVATVIGVAVRVDVLANDLDGNCDAIDIATFSPTSNRGGSIVRSTGTGPGGRDELLYTPPASGATDRFTYTVTDGALTSTSATVTISLLTPRTPDSPWSLRSGSRARYYSMEDQFVPDYDTRTAYASDVVSTIDFASSDGAFATSGRTEYVGARFTGTLNVASSGDYAFFTESDDGSILYVDDRVVAANDGFHGMVERGGMIQLAAGAHAVRVDYFAGGRPSGLIARIQGPGFAKQVIPAVMWSPPGVAVSYYNIEQLPTNLPGLNALVPYHEDVVSEISAPASTNFVFGSGRRYGVAAQFTGYFYAEQYGVYTFSIESDDGSRLIFGNTQLINNDGYHGMREYSAPVALLPGYHEFRINWMQGGGDSGLIFRVEGPGLPRQVVPANRLLSEIPDDCDRNGVADRDQTTETLDIGDMIAGGDGRGSGPFGYGIVARTGELRATSEFGDSGENTPAPVFNATDGQAGRANLPLIDGVFVPRGATQVSTTGVQFRFSPTSGYAWDCVRGDVCIRDISLSTIDAPGANRGGVGLHANAGVTIDLDAVRAANPGREVARLEAIAGANTDVVLGNLYFEIWVLVDGEPRYRALFGGDARLFEPIEIALGPGDRFLTLAATDAGDIFADHAVLSNAKLLITSVEDLDGNGLPDACECDGDVNADGSRDLVDLATLLRWFGTASDASRRQGDLDLDGDVDLADLAVLLSVFGSACPG